jgi:hypothetical protein
MRPLWQILISLKERSQTDSLDCNECFHYLEHLADEAIAGADKSTLQRAIKVHLHNCPDCQEHHQRRMEEMEAKIVSQEEHKTIG